MVASQYTIGITVRVPSQYDVNIDRPASMVKLQCVEDVNCVKKNSQKSVLIPLLMNPGSLEDNTLAIICTEFLCEDVPKNTANPVSS